MTSRSHRRPRQNRDLLTKSLRTHLVPAFTTRGFAVTPLRREGPIDREFERSFPSWGRLIRTRESGLDLVEIQLAPRGRDAFRINAGVVPKHGLTTLGGHWPAEDVPVHWLHEHFETHARPWLRPGLRALGLEPLGAWFSLRQWPRRSPTQSDYDTLAVRGAGCVPELEGALRDGTLGPHIRRIVLPTKRRDGRGVIG